MIELRLNTSTRDDFRLELEASLSNEGVTAVFGPSGSGKTTLLRCLAGLHDVADGLIRVAGETWQDGTTKVATHERRVGYVFQEPSLFTHLNVAENLAYAEQRAGQAHPGINKKELIKLLDLEPLLNSRAQALSGGEGQRVAIARALLSAPKLLLMDEPLASLDQPRKQELLPYLANVTRQCGIPIMYVSHALDEVVQLADHLLVLDSGKVVQTGSVADVLADPCPLLASQVDVCVALDVKVTELLPEWHMTIVKLGSYSLRVPGTNHTLGEKLRLRVQARDVSLTEVEASGTSILNHLPAQVLGLIPSSDDASVLVQLKVEEQTILARITRFSAEQLNITAGKDVWLQLKSVAVY